MESRPKRASWPLAGLLRVLISAALFALLFSAIDLRQFLQVLQNLSVTSLILFPLLFCISVFLSTWKWSILLESMGIRENLGVLFRLYFISYFWSSFLPTTIGGDGYKFIRMRALHPGKEKEIFSSILLDRAYGFGTLIFLHFLAAIYFLRVWMAVPLLLWTEAAIALGVVLGLVLWLRRAAILKLRWGRFQWFDRFIEKVGRILALIEGQRLWIAVTSILVSGIYVWVGVWAWQVCYAAAGGYVNSLFLLYSSSLSNLVGMLPISVNGLGLVEMVQTLTVQTQHLSKEVIIAAALTARVLGILLAAVGGLVYLLPHSREKIGAD